MCGIAKQVKYQQSDATDKHEHLQSFSDSQGKHFEHSF